MNNNAFCPISFNKIDEHVARLNGFFTVALLVVFLLTGSVLPVVFLVLDFLARGLGQPQWSLLARSSTWILKSAGVKPRLLNAGPKLFAARVGLLFSVLVLLSAVVACKLYPFLYKFIYQRSVDKIDYKTDYQI
ncbi:MAG: DUF4395 domain-containing protein [Bacteroidales bacterium]|nr:DUF4395 domain-containing protein [Bacteroidales bacterium]